ncbi:hypothetical protein SAMN05216464_110184 [Mucilaginibacter pineti]|uniref:Uncharacterized protein n=1 Tax=Mucilaginibacter pineti TaxID=1391627 RepID=A0A1G7GKI7_9SPHI|nr:hypothetical protein [Mucilaginibacter pineti]SDE88563.1 hypothetical protein SAMN05216464_110184 [Mucilaginibacter pineti]
MANTESRLEQENRKLREMDERYKAAYQKETLEHPKFLKERVRNYDEALARVAASPIQEDKAGVRALQLERDQLARKAYPNLFIRLFKKLVDVLSAGNRVAKAQQATADNASSVHGSMEKVGLGDHFNKVQQQMKQGNGEFSLPVSYQVSEREKMELHLNFKRDEIGNCHFENYKATLFSEDGKIKPVQHTFDIQNSDFDTGKAYNLLSGRAVHNGAGSWQQLDFNDKDGAGNLRMKNFLTGYGFDLEKVLVELPLKETEHKTIFQKFMNGEKVEATLLINNKETSYVLVADPQKKEVGVYNQLGRKFTQDELKGKQSETKSTANVQQLIPKVKHIQDQRKGKSVKF